MKRENREDKVSSDMFMMLAEDARGANIFAGLGAQNQQILLERFTHADSESEKRRLIEELTR